MWYFYARSITMASSPEELRELLEQLTALVASQPCTSLCKSVVIQFAQELRAETPGVWTPEVAAAFGAMLKAMTAAFVWPHEQPAITREWVSVLEQVVNFESSSEIICDALEDLAFSVDEHPLALCVCPWRMPGCFVVVVARMLTRACGVTLTGRTFGSLRLV
jgi:hypothetical protein